MPITLPLHSCINSPKYYHPVICGVIGITETKKGSYGLMKKSNQILVTIFVQMLIASIVIYIFPKSSNIIVPVVVVQSILLAIFVYKWPAEYLRERGISEFGGLKLFSGLFPPIGVPVLLIRFLGLVRGLGATLIIFGVAIICEVMLALVMLRAGLVIG